MRMRCRILLAAGALACAGCRDTTEPLSPGRPSGAVIQSTTATGVWEGVHAPPQVKAGQEFQASFTVRNTGSTAAQYAEVSLAVLRPDGSHAYDAGRWVNVGVPAGGTWHGNAVSAIAAGSPAGTWRVSARGRVAGGVWYELAPAGGVNPEPVQLITTGAFAAVVSSVNVYPSSVAPGQWPQITATVRNTSSSDTPWQGHATFRIRATVRRNGVLVKQQDWLSEAFAPNETHGGFAVGTGFDTSVAGQYDVDYTIMTGDGVHLLAVRRQAFMVEPVPAQAACTAPTDAKHRVSYRAFSRAPYGFAGATPWLAVVQNASQTAASTVEIDYIRLWGQVNGADRIIAANEYDDGRFGGEITARTPWFGTPIETMPGRVANGILTIRPSDRRDRIWHPYLERFPRDDISQATDVRLEVRYRITGPAQVQTGLDFWQRTDGVKSNSRVEEAAVTDWNCTAGSWQTVRLERSTEVSAPIAVTTVPAGLAVRVGVPLRASFSVRNFDDDAIRLDEVGIETRRVVNGDPYCDPWVSQHLFGFPWPSTGVTLASGATFSHTSDWTPTTAGTYCLTVVEKRQGLSTWQRTYYAQNHYRLVVAP